MDNRLKQFLAESYKKSVLFRENSAEEIWRMHASDPDFIAEAKKEMDRIRSMGIPEVSLAQRDFASYQHLVALRKALAHATNPLGK